MNSNNRKKDKKQKYPSAEILHSVCYDEFRRAIETYDKIYEKVNIALAFSGVVLLVIMSNFDYTIISRFKSYKTLFELVSLHILTFSSFASAVLIIWAVVQLLLLMRSRSMTVFDSVSIRNENIYCENTEDASMWLIDKYTQSTNEIRPESEKKQKTFDSAVLKIVIALLCYAIAILLEKGFIK